MAFVLPMPTQAQQAKTVQGMVVDETGEPIIGAIIRIEGSKAGGVVTDVDGKFSVPAHAGDKLLVSFVGYVSQTVSDLKNPRIVLKEDNMKLDEVVVVGYGVQKMKNVTGSLTTVTPGEISDLSVNQLGASLSGTVNGLSVTGGSSRPGEAASLMVRQSDAAVSQTNINGFVPNTSPLYVIDDVISDETAFNNLDVSMIESITVLKDASAAVYGSRASFGVILVKTKRGKIGKPVISYSGKFGYSDKISDVKMLSAYEYGRMWNAMKAAIPAGTASKIIEGNIHLTNDLYQADELEAMKGLNYNLMDKYWSAATTQSHSVNVSGGSEAATYFGGISYVTQGGNIGRLDYNRWNYDMGTNININKWLKSSIKLSGNYSEKNTAVNGAGDGTQGDYEYLLTHLRQIPDYIGDMPIASMGVSNSMSPNSLQLYNFGAVQNNGDNSRTNTNNVGINLSAELDFGFLKQLQGLKMKLNYSKNFNNTKNNKVATFLTIYQMDKRSGSGHHLYTDVSDDDLADISSSNFFVRGVSNGNALATSTITANNYQLNYYLTYDRTFGKHDLSGLFSIERSESESEDTYTQAADPLPYQNGQSNTATGEKTGTFGRSESGTLSYIGRINYAYANKYLAEFLIRSDASTNFAPQNYWGTFPSLSLGWVMSEEDWFKNHVKWTDYLKLRVSAGITGRDNIPAWRWMTTYSSSGYENKGAVFGTNVSSNISSAVGVSDQGNPDAHWDTDYKFNLGVDTRLINGKMSVTLDGYYDMNRDIFMSRNTADNFPSTVGTKPTAENFGSIDAYGVELSLGWNDKIGKNFKYFVKVNTGYSDNKVLEEYWPSQIKIDAQHKNQRTDLGDWGMDCMGMFRSYQDIDEYFDKYGITKYMGMSKDAVRPGMLIYRDVRGVQNSDGTYSAPDGVVDATNDIVHLSNRNNPYGFTTNFGCSWKNLEFKAQISANWGGYSFIPKEARTGTDNLEWSNMPSFWNDMFVYEDVYDGSGNLVVAENRNGKYPNLQYANSTSDGGSSSVNSYTSNFWRVSGTRVFLRNFTLAYSLPQAITKRYGIGNCRVNLTGQNVFSFFNPYPNHFMDPLAGNYGDYPNLRTFTLGLNVSF